MPPKPPPRLRKPPPSSTKKEPLREAKRFMVEPWTATDEGEKVVGYADTGMGKTTIFSMMPNPIFIGLDDGGRRIINPKTQEPIQHIPGIESFSDVRDALQQPDLFPKGSSCVIDTATILEQWAGEHVLQTIKTSKGGVPANLKAYGWNDGSSHVLDTMRLILQDLDTLVRRGVNIGLVCQEQSITIANPEGVDYLQACPKLHHDRQYSLMLEICAWADHVFRIDYLNSTVLADGDKTTGKAISRDSTRVINIQGAQYFRAKSRTLNRFVDENGERIESISFDHPADDALWSFVFPEED